MFVGAGIAISRDQLSFKVFYFGIIHNPLKMGGLYLPHPPPRWGGGSQIWLIMIKFDEFHILTPTNWAVYGPNPKNFMDLLEGNTTNCFSKFMCVCHSYPVLGGVVVADHGHHLQCHLATTTNCGIRSSIRGLWTKMQCKLRDYEQHEGLWTKMQCKLWDYETTWGTMNKNTL